MKKFGFCMKRFCFVFAALLCVLSLSAQTNKKATSSSKTSASKSDIPAVSIDGDTFSYALGVAQSESLKRMFFQKQNVDSAYLSYAVDGMNAEVSEDEAKKAIAYAAGLYVGLTNKKNVPEHNKMATGTTDTTYINLKEFQRGLTHGVLGEEAAFSRDSALTLVEEQLRHQEQVYKQTNIDWLETNKTLNGIHTTPSGLQYRVITQGTGAVPTDSTEVEVHYEGKLIDGTVFDSSYKRNKPSTFLPTQVIKGWKEALLMMPEGSVWDLYIPSELGYGDKNQGRSIPAYSTLIFKVELLKVKDPKAKK